MSRTRALFTERSFFFLTTCVFLTRVVQSTEDPQLVHGVEHVVFRWRIHEVEEQQVLHAQRLQQQHHVSQVCALDLRDGGGQHLVLEGALSV